MKCALIIFSLILSLSSEVLADVTDKTKQDLKIIVAYGQELDNCNEKYAAKLIRFHTVSPAINKLFLCRVIIS